MNGFDNVHEKRNRSLTYIGDLRASVLYAGLRFQALGVSANKRKELLGIAEHLNRCFLDASLGDRSELPPDIGELSSRFEAICESVPEYSATGSSASANRAQVNTFVFRIIRNIPFFKSLNRAQIAPLAALTAARERLDELISERKYDDAEWRDRVATAAEALISASSITGEIDERFNLALFFGADIIDTKDAK